MNLKNIKFPLGIVINLLTAISFGYICFLASNFETLGNKEKSIITVLIIIVLLIMTSLGAKMAKQTTKYFKEYIIFEYFLLTLFTCIILYASYQYFSHYFVVSARKTNIQTITNTNISQAEQMYPQYMIYFNKRQGNYNRQLFSAIRNKRTFPSVYRDFGYNPLVIADSINTNNLKFKLESALLPENFKSMKTVDSTWFANAKHSVDNWESIKLVDVINDIDTNANNSLSKLIRFSKEKAINENIFEEFSLNPSFSFSDVKGNFTSHGSPPPIAVLFTILAWLLMLLPWFIAKRDTRSIGARTTAKYEVVL